MKNEISALIDGELGSGAVDGCLRRLKQENDLSQTWHDYHLIGDVLRGEISPSLDARFARRLAAEPTILAPRPVVAANGSRWSSALSAVAGIAAVAVAAWVALPQTDVVPAPVSIASTAPTTSAPAPASSPRPAEGVSGVPVAVGVEDYLLAHQRFSPVSSMQGVAPYIRTVSAERKSDGR